MKQQKSFKRFILCIFLMLSFVITIHSKSYAVEFKITENLYYELTSETKTSTKIKISNIKGENYLFLPSSADLSNLNLKYNDLNTIIYLQKEESKLQIKSGEIFNFTEFYGAKPLDGKYNVTIESHTYEGIDLPEDLSMIDDVEPTVERFKLIIMKSNNIDSMYIESSNPEEYGREYIESSSDHTLKATGKVALIDKEGNSIYDDKLNEIKGRGNSTWAQAKKPYQIKLDKKTDLINRTDESNKNKKWVLLANYMDTTLLHNEFVFNLGKELGMLETPDCKQIDLYYDGEYRGTYLLSEKVEIDETRVNINDLEKEIEKANPDVQDFDELPTVISKDEHGHKYQYVEGLKNPTNITGGYLIELDSFYYKSEKSWFETDNGKYYVVKSPEYCSKEAIEYIQKIFCDIEYCADNGGVSPYTGKKIEDYIDVESFAKFILIQELIKNSDGFVSSTYFYIDKDSDKLFAGALWDFDTALGIRTFPDYLENYEGMLNRTNLITIPCISEKINEILFGDINTCISEIFLGNKNGKYLKNLDKYVENIYDSQHMNYVVWEQYIINQKEFETYDESIKYFKDFINKRLLWMQDYYEKRQSSYNAYLLSKPYFFDPLYYLEKYPDLKQTIGKNYEALYNHFLTHGIKEGRQGSPVFDPKYYLLKYEDLFNTYKGENKYINALNHFMNFGIYENRVGSYEFDPIVYVNTFEDVRKIIGDRGPSLYEHFVKFGYNEGRRAFANYKYPIFFDSKYYADSNVDLKNIFGYDENKLLEHYINNGIMEGRAASSVFDPIYYLNKYQDLSKAFTGKNRYVKALYHFFKNGIYEYRKASIEFELGAYKENNSELVEKYGNDNIAYFYDYIKEGKSLGRKAVRNLIYTNNIFFDAEYYLNKYPDLKKAYGLNYELAYQHYLICGIKEGRVASKVFDPAYYLNTYIDLQKTFNDELKYEKALKHFIIFGIKEGRVGSNEFNVHKYKANYKDLNDAFGNYLKSYYEHYLNFGQFEGRKAK